MHVWNHKAYWEWYKCIENNVSDKAVGIEAEVVIDVEDWGTQWLENLIAPNKKLELDK